MQPRHNAQTRVGLGDFQRPVSIAFGEPLGDQRRFKGNGALNLNSDDAVRLTNNKPALFRALSRGEMEVPLPDWAPVEQIYTEDNGVDYDRYEGMFPSGSIMRGKDSSHEVLTIGDLISFLSANRGDKNYVVIERPEHFRYGSVSCIPALNKQVQYGAFNAEISEGQIPEKVLMAAYAAASTAKVDYCRIDFIIANTQDGDKIMVTNVTTKFVPQDAEHINKLIRHKLGLNPRK